MDTPTFTSSVHYQDPKAALAWLERAFGFEITMAIEGPPEAPDDVPLRDERRRARAHHDRRAVGGMGEEPQKPGRRQHARGPRHARGGPGRALRAGARGGGIDRRRTRRRSSTAIARTAPPISRGIGGPSPSTCATCRARRRKRRSASRSRPRTGRERPSQTDRRRVRRARRSGAASGGRAARAPSPQRRRARPRGPASPPRR